MVWNQGFAEGAGHLRHLRFPRAWLWHRENPFQVLFYNIATPDGHPIPTRRSAWGQPAGTEAEDDRLITEPRVHGSSAHNLIYGIGETLQLNRARIYSLLKRVRARHALFSSPGLPCPSVYAPCSSRPLAARPSQGSIITCATHNPEYSPASELEPF